MKLPATTKTLLSIAGACLLSAFQPFSSSAFSAAAPAVALRIELDRSVFESDITEKAIVKVCLDGVRPARPEARQPVNLSIVLDRSGSMGGDRIERAKEAAFEAVSRLAPDDIISLVVYDTTATTLIPARCVGNGRDIERIIGSIRAGGNTALYAGVTQGASELRKNIEDRRYVHRIILLSDGQANEGPSSPDELGRLGAALGREGIAVTTIGVGLGYNEDLMTRLALRSDGNTYFAESSASLPRIFAAELGDVLNVVARRAVVRVDFPEGIRPLAIVGRNGVIKDSRAEIPLGQIYGGQEKFALIEVEIVPTRAGAEREIARARITCEDIAAQRPVELTALGRARFSSDRAAVIASANLQVQADFAANRTAEVKDKAVELADRGQKDEAARLLMLNSTRMKSIGTTYANREVLKVSESNAGDAEIIRLEKFSPQERKKFRTDSANIINQQTSSSSSIAPAPRP